MEAHQQYDRLRDLSLPELLWFADHVSAFIAEKNDEARADAEARRSRLYDAYDRPLPR